MKLFLLLLLIILVPGAQGLAIGVSPPRIYLNTTDCSGGASGFHVYNPNDQRVYFRIEYNNNFLGIDEEQGLIDGNGLRTIGFRTTDKLRTDRYLLPVITRFSYDNFSTDSSIGAGVMVDIHHEKGCGSSGLQRITGSVVSLREHADEMVSAFFLCILGCGLLFVSLLLKERNEKKLKLIRKRIKKRRKRGDKDAQNSGRHFE